jgi:hypothetical protein
MGHRSAPPAPSAGIGEERGDCLGSHACVDVSVSRMDVAHILSEVLRIAPTLHTAGTFSARTLEAVFRHASLRPVHHSVETGSGASTLLFSHLSPDHTVFALDAGTGSIRSIEASPLMRRESVTFVEGPTQLTLPAHTFEHGLQLALIDGPHGYPFPDLEYYYLYPHLDTGALLILDDVHIPTITNLFDFLSVDDMFELQEVVEATAFFRRTAHPTFSPIGDGWWLQRYNQRAFERSVVELLAGNHPERVEQATPFYVDRFGPYTDPARVGLLQVLHSEELVVSGWAVDARARRPAAAVDLVLDGVAYRAAVKVPRADVAAFHDEQAYARSGFDAHFPAGVLSRGQHELEVRVVFTGAREYYSAARFQFEAV